VSRFRLDHPTRHHVRAEYGHDAVVGFYADVMLGHRVIASYDFFHAAFNRARPLLGCLDFLVSEDFFTGEDLEAALAVIADDFDVPAKVARVVEVIERFKSD
jgi:hypothetical protein